MKLVKCVAICELLASVGCGPLPDRQAVIGKYAANHGQGLDTIELKGDGTYLYYFRGNDGKEFRNAGDWTFHLQDGKPRITFNRFWFGLTEYGHGPGYWDVEVERTWRGQPCLCLDPDLSYYYIKQPK